MVFWSRFSLTATCLYVETALSAAPSCLGNESQKEDRKGGCCRGVIPAFKNLWKVYGEVL